MAHFSGGRRPGSPGAEVVPGAEVPAPAEAVADDDGPGLGADGWHPVSTVRAATATASQPSRRRSIPREPCPAF